MMRWWGSEIRAEWTEGKMGRRDGDISHGIVSLMINVRWMIQRLTVYTRNDCQPQTAQLIVERIRKPDIYGLIVPRIYKLHIDILKTALRVGRTL